MTMRKVELPGIYVKAKPTGEYGYTLDVSIFVPAKFDIDDPKLKEPYSMAWSQSRGLPPAHPFASSIEKVKESYRISEMLFCQEPNGSFVQFKFLASNNMETKAWLEDLFGSQNITFL